jgi:hypothetical protein
VRRIRFGRGSGPVITESLKCVCPAMVVLRLQCTLGTSPRHDDRDTNCIDIDIVRYSSVQQLGHITQTGSTVRCTQPPQFKVCHDSTVFGIPASFSGMFLFHTVHHHGARITYLLTYLLTPCSTVLLEKVTRVQPVKKFPTFYGTRRFITAFTSALQLFLS